MLKKIITTTLLTASTLSIMAAHAAVPGIYVTGQLGSAANTQMKGKILSDANHNSHVTMRDSGLAGRIAVGYQFTPHWAVELGYLQLHNQIATVTAGGPYAPGTETVKQNALDMAAKATLPLTDKFDIYGKAGVAYLSSTITSNFYGTKGDQNNHFGVAKHKLAPEAAVGISYDITSNVSVDTSWTHIQPIGNKRPGNIDFVAVGVGYNFG